jgi:membrane protein
MISWLPKTSTARLWQILKNTVQQMRDGEIQLVAASLSFSTIIGLVPFLAVVLATFHSIGNLESLYPHVESFLLIYLREAAGSNVTKFIRIFIQNINAGKLGTTGAIFLILTSLKLLHDMEVGINRVWAMPRTRPFYKRLMYQWILILAFPIALAIYVGFTTLEQFEFVRQILPVSVSNSLLLVGCLYFIYKKVPDIEVRTKSAFISALIASITMWCTHNGFSYLTVRVFNYNKIYGSFAAIPILLLWLLTLWYIILGGVALCAGMHKRI